MPSSKRVRSARRHAAHCGIATLASGMPIVATSGLPLSPLPPQPASDQGRQSRPVAWPGFKPGGGRQPFLGEFDSHCLPPISPSTARLALGIQFKQRHEFAVSVEELSKTRALRLRAACLSRTDFASPPQSDSHEYKRSALYGPQRNDMSNLLRRLNTSQLIRESLIQLE